jgi:hypothetical protein
MNRILLIFYTLAAFLSREKKDLILNGTWFIFGTTLFFNTVSFMFYIVPRLPFKLNNIVLLVILISVGYVTQYGIKKWTYKKIKELEIHKQYNLISQKYRYIISGFIILIISFFLMFIVGVVNFSGYLS